MAGDAGGALYLEYAKRWNLVPLGDSLFGDGERLGEPGEPAGPFDRSIERGF